MKSRQSVYGGPGWTVRSEPDETRSQQEVIFTHNVVNSHHVRYKLKLQK